MKQILKSSWVFYSVRVLEAAAFSTAMPFLLLHFMNDFGLSATAAGAIVSIREVVPIFTGIFMGWFITKVERKLMLVVLLVILSLAAFEYMKGFYGAAGLYLASFISGLAYSGMRVIFASSIPALMKSQDFTQGFAMLHAAANLGFSLGPLLSGYWVVHKNYTHAFFVAMVLYLTAAVLIWFWLPQSKADDGEFKGSRSMREIFSALGLPGCAFLGVMYLVMIFNGIRLQMHLMGLAKYFVDYFHSAKAASFYWIFQSLLVVALVPISGRIMRNWPTRFLFIAYAFGSILACLGNVTLGYFDSTSLVSSFFVLVFFTTAGEMVFSPCPGAILARISGKHHAGFLFGIGQTMMALGLAIGGGWGGMVMDQAIRTNSLPFYWKTLGMFYVPSLIVIALAGYYILRFYLPKFKDSYVPEPSLSTSD